MKIQNKKPNTDYRILTTRKGFTLIETLVAITVLLLSIMGPLQIAAQALFSAFYARDEITAFYLAAEAIEYVKNARDTVFLEDVFHNTTGVPIPNDHWLYGFDECMADIDKNGCTIDAREPFIIGSSVPPALAPDTIKPCSVSVSGGCPPINFDSSSGIWNYTIGTPSKFTRTIEIIPQLVNEAPNEAIIEVTVKWQSNALYNGERKVFLTGLISNWQRQ